MITSYNFHNSFPSSEICPVTNSNFMSLSHSPERPPVEEVVAGQEGSRGGRALDAGGRSHVRVHRRRRREEPHPQVAQALPQVRVRRAVAYHNDISFHVP